METIKSDDLDIILLFLTAQYGNRLTRSMKYYEGHLKVPQ